MFDLAIVSAQKKIFDGAVESVWIDGDESEYELLSFHGHLIGQIRRRIVINKTNVIPIKKGIVRFYENKCVIIVQQEGVQDSQNNTSK